jgi:dihydroxyacetone kinase
MTYLCNNPDNFVDEATAGFAAANSRWVRRVNGGVIRRRKARPGHAVVVIGGGSGHYPAFAGLVGAGLAHGAAIGHVFASPSAQQIYSVARAVEVGGGVLFCYGNYAGDVLNFDQAQARLRAEGIDVRTVVVTDDIASAPPTEPHRRRGIAGDLPVFKAASVEADAGASLEQVFRIAGEANARVRTLGVAFSACTLPGAKAPLFSIEPGKMDVGMGIHGEPGLYRADLPSADSLAKILVDRLLTEVPEGDDFKTGRVGLILNGLGAVKYEELFVVYRRVEELLSSRGLTIVDPEVGELVTSFEMAGVSLTLFWLTPHLEKTWTAPANTPAFRKGSIAVQVEEEEADYECPRLIPDFTPGAPESHTCARAMLPLLAAAAKAIDAEVGELGRLDAIAGDGDHGIGMQRGIAAAQRAAAEACAAGVGLGSFLRAAGDAWADSAGGTSGALWGVMLRSVGDEIGDRVGPAPLTISNGIQAALRAVTEAGGASEGDKTLVDALAPFARVLAERVAAGATMSEAWCAASRAAELAARSTATLLPRIGRARPHAEKSVGTPDPGAVSMALILRACTGFVEDSPCH